ncbi:SufE family protein [Raoultibacter timonensis]|uniref:SufE family protein n=1 Tax=Raoultibacter timonensis TaxID=1907662 RepID=UPI0015E16AEF|nr:SufE family protein [Raoultibacter timonensis]
MSEPALTIDEEQRAIVEEFEELGDAFAQYTYLLELSARLPAMNDSEKESCVLVDGCQSQVWLAVTANDDGTMSVRGDSDTLIVRGVLFLIVRLLDGRMPAEVASTPLSFLEETDLKSAFSDERIAGFASICATIRTLSKTIADSQGDDRQ